MPSTRALRRSAPSRHTAKFDSHLRRPHRWVGRCRGRDDGCSSRGGSCERLVGRSGGLVLRVEDLALFLIMEVVVFGEVKGEHCG